MHDNDFHRLRVVVQIDRQRLTDACNNVDGDVRRKRQTSDLVYVPADVLQPALQDNVDVIQGVRNNLYVRFYLNCRL